MEKIELFDKYISGEMSEDEITDFKRKLSDDKDLSSDFQIYKIIVKGICKEENDKEADLDNAFKSLSKDDLRKIVGPKLVIVKGSKPKAKIVYMVSWVASVAAIVVIAFTFTFNIQRSARNNVDDVMFDCYYNPVSRSASNIEDLSGASIQQIQQVMPTLVQEYNKATDVQDITEQGINLAMVYLKLHDREKAKYILNDVKQKCLDNVQIQKQCDKLLDKLQ